VIADNIKERSIGLELLVKYLITVGSVMSQGVTTLARKPPNKKLQSIDIADIDIALQMLNKYLDTPDVEPLITALETLKTEPQNEAYQEQIIKVFDELGSLQGAALTYAPYLNIFVSDDPFGD